ncbi:hypothetical protein Q6670_004077 [Salmonella enterica]|nr:hypothetical protein [Salmonella enterica]
MKRLALVIILTACTASEGDKGTTFAQRLPEVLVTHCAAIQELSAAFKAERIVQLYYTIAHPFSECSLLRQPKSV